MAHLNEQTILEMVNQRTSELGVRSKKFAGAVTVRVIAEALRRCGIRCSTPNVFIRTVPNEIDLVLAPPAITPWHGILYEPHDVLAALEVKKLGSFGPATIAKVREDFRAVRRANRTVRCVYVTITERKGFRYAVTAKNIGAKAYTLLWHKGSGSKLTYEPTGDWGRLVTNLQQLLGGAASRTGGRRGRSACHLKEL
jgi:hypothetical protein